MVLAGFGRIINKFVYQDQEACDYKQPIRVLSQHPLFSQRTNIPTPVNR